MGPSRPCLSSAPALFFVCPLLWLIHAKTILLGHSLGHQRLKEREGRGHCSLLSGESEKAREKRGRRKHTNKLHEWKSNGDKGMQASPSIVDVGVELLMCPFKRATRSTTHFLRIHARWTTNRHSGGGACQVGITESKMSWLSCLLPRLFFALVMSWSWSWSPSFIKVQFRDAAQETVFFCLFSLVDYSIGPCAVLACSVHKGLHPFLLMFMSMSCIDVSSILLLPLLLFFLTRNKLLLGRDAWVTPHALSSPFCCSFLLFFLAVVGAFNHLSSAMAFSITMTVTRGTRPKRIPKMD